VPLGINLVVGLRLLKINYLKLSHKKQAKFDRWEKIRQFWGGSQPRFAEKAEPDSTKTPISINKLA
jgi:hypothetical protein